MSEADISKIIGRIMENPSLVEEIRALADDSGTSKEAAKNPESQTEEVKASVASEPRPHPSRRRELLCALKPYLSEERSRAVDQMLSITDILEMMRSK